MSGRVTGGVGTGVGAMVGGVGGVIPGARSWHPSPFVSDDDASSDEPQFYKEEKKNRIKMEIARRRQQIEENACLHEELTRLAKLRETAELGGGGAATAVGVMATGHNVPFSSGVGGVVGGGVGGVPTALTSRLTTGIGGTSATSGNPHHLGVVDGGVGAAVAASAATANSVLKSVDEVLRDGGVGVGTGLGLGTADPLALNTTSSAALTGLGSSYRSSRLPGVSSTLVDGHIPGATTTALGGVGTGLSAANAFNPDIYTASAYERTTDFSPMNSELSDFTSVHPHSRGGRGLAGTVAGGTSAVGLGATVGGLVGATTTSSALLPNSIPTVGGLTTAVGAAGPLTDGLLSDPLGKYSKQSAVTSAFK